MITTVKLINRSIISHHFFVFLLVRKVKTDSLGNTQVYNTGLLTLVTTLHIRSPELIHLIAGSCIFDQYLPIFHPPPSPWRPLSTPYSCKFV